MGSKSGKTIEQPGANVPEYSLTPNETATLDTYRSVMSKLYPYMSDYLTGAMDQNMEMAQGEASSRAAQRAFIDPIFSGNRLGGDYSILGTPYGTDYEQEIFDRNLNRSQVAMNQYGMLSSGAMNEMARKNALDIALESVGNQRSELFNLAQLASGQNYNPDFFGGASQTLSAAETAAQAMLNQGTEQRNYQLSAAQARTPQVVGYNPGLVEGAMAPMLGTAVGSWLSPGGMTPFKVTTK